MRLAGPVDGISVSQFIRRRPDAEIWIARDQRDGRWTERLRVHLERNEQKREQNADVHRAFSKRESVNSKQCFASGGFVTRSLVPRRIAGRSTRVFRERPMISGNPIRKRFSGPDLFERQEMAFVACDKKVGFSCNGTFEEHLVVWI